MNLSFTHWLVIVSVPISLSGGIVYIHDTLVGKTRPNRVSWFMWTLAPLIGTGAALSAHAETWSTVRIFIAGFVPLLVFLASFINQKSFWKLNTFDALCGICSLFALIVWGAAHSPQNAILLAALGDGFAALPTIRKAWKYPETESGLTFFASLIATLLVIPSIPKWNIENSAFQIYLLIANAVILFSIYRKRIKIF